MVGAQVKKVKVSQETHGDCSDHNDAELVLSIEKLQDIQDELDKVNEEASEKVLEVEQKYNEIRKPVYDKRNEIIKQIPHFWMTSFLSHPALADLLNEEDSKIFKFLDSVHVEDFKDMKSGYSITFQFKENPYFEDVKLTKTFTFLDEGMTHITGTNIKWKEGMGAATNHEMKGNKRALSDESFFSWFSENQETDIVEGITDEVAEIIKEDLWPNPLKFFHTDEVCSDEDDDDDDQQDEDEEDDDNE